jgi:predicted Mrr-cat superfamily restriction endonuclease
MSKLLRSELKSIVKECLVEILAEGIGTNARSIVRENKITKEKSSNLKAKKTTRERRSSYLDDTKIQKKKTIASKTNLTDNPLLNEMLADTAQTTLHEQIAADSKRRMSEISTPADAAALKVRNSQPEDLFGGETASKWAKLAFFDQ